MAIAEIHVTLKPTLLDTQGATVLKALRQLGHEHVQNVRVGKHIAIELDDALSMPALQAELDAMCRELLANPVIEDYSITLNGNVARGAAPTVESPQLASSDAVNAASGISTSDVVPHPQPLKANAGHEPAQPAQMSAPRISSPQNVSTQASAPTSATSVPFAPPSAVPATPVARAIEAMPASALASTAATSNVATSNVATTSLPDPFSLDYAAYDAMTTDEKLALQARAWQAHGNWIAGELNTRRAAWILCVGQSVLESGDSLDTYPSDERLETLGVSNDLVPLVFVRPPA